MIDRLQLQHPKQKKHAFTSKPVLNKTTTYLQFQSIIDLLQTKYINYNLPSPHLPQPKKSNSPTHQVTEIPPVASVAPPFVPLPPVPSAATVRPPAAAPRPRSPRPPRPRRGATASRPRGRRRRLRGGPSNGGPAGPRRAARRRAREAMGPGEAWRPCEGPGRTYPFFGSLWTFGFGIFEEQEMLPL